VNERTALASHRMLFNGRVMAWHDVSYLLALVLLVVAVGSAFLAERPAMRDYTRFLWAIATISTLGILVYLAATLIR
jgi:hypothetical protein